MFFSFCIYMATPGHDVRTDWLKHKEIKTHLIRQPVKSMLPFFAEGTNHRWAFILMIIHKAGSEFGPPAKRSYIVCLRFDESTKAVRPWSDLSFKLSRGLAMVLRRGIDSFIRGKKIQLMRNMVLYLVTFIHRSPCVQQPGSQIGKRWS